MSRYDDDSASRRIGTLDPRWSAIRAATDALLAEQRPDGHWVFELEADATIPAEYVLLRHYLGEAPMTSSSSARSPSICAASRARMAAGRCSTTAPSTSAPA